MGRGAKMAGPGSCSRSSSPVRDTLAARCAERADNTSLPRVIRSRDNLQKASAPYRGQKIDDKGLRYFTEGKPPHIADRCDHDNSICQVDRPRCRSPHRRRHQPLRQLPHRGRYRSQRRPRQHLLLRRYRHPVALDYIRPNRMQRGVEELECVSSRSLSYRLAASAIV